MTTKQSLLATLLFSAFLFLALPSFAGKHSTNVNFGQYKKSGVGCSGTGICGMNGNTGANVNFQVSGQPNNPLTITMTFSVREAEANGFPAGKKSGTTYSFDGDDYTFTGNEGTGVPANYVLTSGTQGQYTYSGDNGTISGVVVNYVAPNRRKKNPKKK
jgi:hypothetical protein